MVTLGEKEVLGQAQPKFLEFLRLFILTNR